MKIEASQSEGAEIAGSEVTMDKNYGLKLFEVKVMKVEGSWSEVAGSEVTMDKQYGKKYMRRKW